MKKVNTTVEGLDIQFSGVAGKLYATIYHLQSGKTIHNFKTRPLGIGKREFCKIVDKHLHHLDWTVDIELLSPDEYNKYLVAHNDCGQEILDNSFNK